MFAELPKIATETHPTSRKEHKCCECHGIIRRGEKYQRYEGLWDDWDTYKTCSDCESLRNDIYKTLDVYDREEGIPFALLYDHVFEARNNSEYVKRFVETMQMRGAKIEDWMLKKYQEVLALQETGENK